MGALRTGIGLGVAVLLVATLAVTVAAQPSLSVAVDGTTIQDGETVDVTDDPVLGIESSGNESIESVTVQVDGETRHRFEPGSTTFSERLTLDLDDGDHDVAVVVEGSEGEARLTATIRKDSAAPRVTYTSPFESAGYPTNGEVTINRGNTTLAADFEDRSGIREVRIERTYRWTFAGSSDRARDTYRIENPGDNVSQPILFGLGENDLEVEVIDVHGQRRTHDITVRVNDLRRPRIDLDRFERSDGDLRVAGTVSDEVKVKSLRYRFEGRSQETFVLNPTSKEPTRERVHADFEFTANPPEGAESIILVAPDVAGNTREWEVPLDYRGHLEPTITIDEGETRVTGDEISVVGRVTDGQVRRVVIESVGPDGNTVDTATVYDGDAASRVRVRGRVRAASGETTVVIRAVDTDGRDHRESLTLETPVRTATERSTPTATMTERSTATATRTPTAVDTATPTPAAAAESGGEGDGGEQESETGDSGSSTLFLALGLVGVVAAVALLVVGLIAGTYRLADVVESDRWRDLWPPKPPF